MSSLNVADVCKLIISTNGRCTDVHTFLMEFKSCSNTFQVHSVNVANQNIGGS